MPDPTTAAQSCQVPRNQAPYPDPLPGIIPYGSVCIMSGASGVGKTILKAEWVKRWIDGRSILGVASRRPTHFYYLAVDRPWHPTYADAFATAGVSAKDLTIYAVLDDPNYDPRVLTAKNASALNFFEVCLQKLQPIPGSLLHVDPFAPLFIQGDQNNARSVALSLHWIRKCAAKYQITTICDANVSKLKADEDFKRPQERISGSGAFLAYADTQFNFTADGPLPGDPRTLVWHPRRSAAGSEQFVFDPKTRLFVLYDGLRDKPEPGKEVAPNEDRLTLILEQFPGEEPITLADLHARVLDALHLRNPGGKILSRDTLERDLKILLRRELIEWPQRGLYRRRKRA